VPALVVFCSTKGNVHIVYQYGHHRGGLWDAKHGHKLVYTQISIGMAKAKAGNPQAPAWAPFLVNGFIFVNVNWLYIVCSIHKISSKWRSPASEQALQRCIMFWRTSLRFQACSHYLTCPYNCNYRIFFCFRSCLINYSLKVTANEEV
jgi:hypothetical protein